MSAFRSMVRVGAAFELLGLVGVRVVPERSGVRDDELVLECLPGLDRRLHGLGSVHLRGHADPVPMYRRGLRQVVRQPNLDSVAGVRVDQRPQNLTVVGEAANGPAGRELPFGLTGLAFERDTAGLGTALRGCIHMPASALDRNSKRRRTRLSTAFYPSADFSETGLSTPSDA